MTIFQLELRLIKATEEFDAAALERLLQEAVELGVYNSDGAVIQARWAFERLQAAGYVVGRLEEIEQTATGAVKDVLATLFQEAESCMRGNGRLAPPELRDASERLQAMDYAVALSEERGLKLGESDFKTLRKYEHLTLRLKRFYRCGDGGGPPGHVVPLRQRQTCKWTRGSLVATLGSLEAAEMRLRELDVVLAVAEADDGNFSPEFARLIVAMYLRLRREGQTDASWEIGDRGIHLPKFLQFLEAERLRLRTEKEVIRELPKLQTTLDIVALDKALAEARDLAVPNWATGGTLERLKGRAEKLCRADTLHRADNLHEQMLVQQALQNALAQDDNALFHNKAAASRLATVLAGLYEAVEVAEDADLVDAANWSPVAEGAAEGPALLAEVARRIAQLVSPFHAIEAAAAAEWAAAEAEAAAQGPAKSAAEVRAAALAVFADCAARDTKAAGLRVPPNVAASTAQPEALADYASCSCSALWQFLFGAQAVAQDTAGAPAARGRGFLSLYRLSGLRRRAHARAFLASPVLASSRKAHGSTSVLPDVS